MSGPPLYRFFGGKGGVGKTTCAAATAVVAADRGRRILLVSTDPAHSLGDALGVGLGPAPRRVGRLDAVELDADRALRQWWRSRRPTLGTIAERGTYLDEEDVGRFLGLSLPGVDELIGLLELARLAREKPYQQVVVDTAPTGHTLRLFEMPETLRRIASVLDDMQAKHRFLAASLGGAHRPDAADRLVQEIDTDGRALAELLRDPARCGFSWVLVPERMALEEARDGVRHLDDAGIRVGEIVVNRVTPATSACPRCGARSDAERAVVDEVFKVFTDRIVRLMPAEDVEPRGIPALRRLGRHLASPARRPRQTRRAPASPSHRHRTAVTATTAAGHPAWLDLLAPAGVRLCLVGGKGGVGKTTTAAALALAIAQRDPGQRVLVLSTDPAHSLGDVLLTKVGDEESAVPGAPSNLAARELDADRAFQARRERYRDAVDRAFTAVLSRGGIDATFDRTVARELLELAPPGLDELFGMLALVDALFRTERPWHTIVVDTAPTGHTLRLLRMPATALEWVKALLATVLKYRAVIGLGDFATDLVGMSRDLRRLGELLRDPAQTRFIVVTRPAELPRRETLRLLSAVARLGIAVPAIVVNAVTDVALEDTPGTRAPREARARDRRAHVVACRRCAHGAATEVDEIAALARAARRHRQSSAGLVIAPAVTPPPAGVGALSSWGATWRLRPGAVERAS